jgi:DMSO/TMAO reductase YedYZ molybdopterin-dependent catalytic subunit
MSCLPDLEGYMSEQFVSRGFQGQWASLDTRHRLPPGQHAVTDFPVLSVGPTPYIPVDEWHLTLDGLVQESITWRWEEFAQRP